MAQAFFRVELTVRPKAGGGAEIVAPKILEGLTWHFVVVKEGAAEAIVAVEGTESTLANVGKDPACTKFAKNQLEAMRKSYPAPKVKKKLRPAGGEAGAGGGDRPAVDEKGNRIADTVQHVRAGFYIIDVPLGSPSS